MQLKNGDFIYYCVSDFTQIQLENKKIAKLLCDFLNKRDNTNEYKVRKIILKIGMPEYKDEEIVKQLNFIKER